MLVMVMPGETHARTANLMGEPIDNAMMALLGDLPYLEQLILNDTGLRDEHLAPLAGLVRLNSLSLGRNALTGEGLRHLSRLRGLETLALRGNPDLGDQGLEVIGRLSRLRVLDLALCNVSDAGIARLTGLSRLQHLILADNPVTDEGAQLLANLPSLSRVNLGGTRVTPAGVRALSQARPGINIELQSLAEQTAPALDLPSAAPRETADDSQRGSAQ